VKQKSLWELYGGKDFSTVGAIGREAILSNIRDAAINKYKSDTQKSIEKLKCWIKGGGMLGLHLGDERMAVVKCTVPQKLIDSFEKFVGVDACWNHDAEKEMLMKLKTFNSV
jgi:hypothetical protein